MAVKTASKIICCSKFLLNKSSSTPISAIAIIKLKRADSKKPPANIFDKEIFENISNKDGTSFTTTAMRNK